MNQNEIYSISILRGIAILAVLLAHFSGKVPILWIQNVFHPGIWGVNLFFIISGFIIPFSMLNNNYTIKKLPYFLLKRTIRLEPPYIISIVLIFLIASFSSSGIQNEIFSLNTVYNLFYLVDFLKGSWINVVFWTLAIEIQFYILLALLFPILFHKNKIIQEILFFTLIISSFLFKNDIFVFHYLNFFLVGTLLLKRYKNEIQFPFFVLKFTLLITLLTIKHDISGVICPLVAFVFLFHVSIKIKVLQFLGTISYSLYLLHTPLGTDGFINYFQKNIDNDYVLIFIVLMGIFFTLICSYLFFLFIENKAKQLSQKIKY